MTHLDEGRLRAWLDGELTPAEGHDVERWLRDDPGLRETVDELRARDRTVRELLERLDVAPPTERVREAVQAARSTRRLREDGAHRSWNRRSLAQAAVLVLALAGAASAAIPGSPVRALLDGLRGLASGRGTPSPPVVTPAATPSDQRVQEEEGVAVRLLPVDGQVRVELTGVPRGAEVRVALVDGVRASVHAPQGTAWETGAGWIRANVLEGPVRVELPRDLPRADLLVDGRVYMTKRGDRMDLRVPATDSSATEIRFLAGS